MNSPSLVLIGFIVSIELVTGAVQIVSRGEWGARVPKSQQAMAVPVQHVFIHHTAGSSCSDMATCSKVMRQTQNFHMDNRKWEDIGYSFLGGGDGRIYEGRGWRRVGAHTVNYNSKSIALSFLGNFQTTLPNPAKFRQMITDFIDFGIAKGYIAKNYQLHGHRDAACTACPGNALYKEIKKLKNFKGGKLPGYKC